MSRFKSPFGESIAFALPILLPTVLCAEDRVVVSFPRFGVEPTHRVVSVDAAKHEVRIESNDERFFSLVAEGPSLLVVPGRAGASPDTAVRVEVTEILDDGSARATFGAAATDVVRTGPAYFGRPFAGDLNAGPPRAAATKLVRGLPDIVRSRLEEAGPSRPEVVSAAQATATRLKSMNHLKQLGLAFHNYCDSHNAFPPAVVIGPDGKPWHSWRVLLLPYLEEGELYRAYDFSEPWNSPKNRAVAEKMPAVFADPGRPGPAGGLTGFAALVGDHTIFPADLVRMKDVDDFPACLAHGEKISFPQVTDGTSSTILFATVDPERKIPWTKPEDIVLDDTFPGVGKPGGIGAIHPVGDRKAAITVFTDGSGQVIDDRIDRDTIVALATRDGGEFVDRSLLPGTGASQPAAGVPQLRIVAADDGTLRLEID